MSNKIRNSLWLILAAVLFILTGCSSLSLDRPTELPTATPTLQSIILPAGITPTSYLTALISQPSADPGPADPKPSAYPIYPGPATSTIAPLATLTPGPTQTATGTPTPCPPFPEETTLPDPDLPQNYIGRSFNISLTPGLTYYSSRSIGVWTDPVKYSLFEMGTAQHKMLWFEKLVCYDQKRYPYHQIIDVLVLPELKPNEILVDGRCTQSGKGDAEITAIGEYTKNEVLLSKLTHIWRANRSTEKFEEISPVGISCNREIGGD